MQTPPFADPNDVPNLPDEGLNDALLQVAVMFLQWKKHDIQQPDDIANSVPERYRQQVEEITKDVLDQGEPFKKAVEQGVKLARTSKQVAGDIVYFLRQLQEGISPAETIELLEDMQGRAAEVLKNTKMAQESLKAVRLGLRKAEFRIGKLEEVARADADAAEGLSENAVNDWHWFWKLPIIKQLVLAMSDVVSLVTVKGHSKEFKEATQAIHVFEDLKEQIKQAEKAVGLHLNFWVQRSNEIDAVLLDPGRLFGTTGAPKPAIVKKHCEAWKTIENSFEEYGTQSLAALEIFEISES